MEGIITAFLILTGSWAAFRLGWLSFDLVPALRVVVLYITLPAFVFASFVREGAQLFFNGPIIATFAGASLILHAVYFTLGHTVFKLPLERAMLLGHGAVAGNSLLLGVPIFSITFGAAINPVVSQIILFENIILLPLFMIVAETATRGAASPRAITQAIFRNQFLWAVGAAILISTLSIPLPASILGVFDLLGRAAAPIALLTVGGILAKTRMSGQIRPAILAIMAKLAILPFIGLIIGRAIGIDAQTLTILVLFLALPNASIFPVFGEQINFAELSNSIFILAYGAAAFTLALWLHFLT